MNRVLCAIIMCALFPIEAHATDLYAIGGAGGSFFKATTQDGTWRQDGMGSTSMGLTSVTGKVGLGVIVSPEWAVEFAYSYLGSNSSRGQAVHDEEYDPINKRCAKASCPTPSQFGAKDTVQVIELAVLRKFELWGLHPFLKAGVFMGVHDLKYWVQDSTNLDIGHGQYSGYIPGLLVGGGTCYGWVCGEATYYNGLGSTGYPIARNVIVPMLTVKIPF